MVAGWSVCLGLSRPPAVQQDAILPFLGVLIAHVVEGVPERLDGGLDRGLDVFPLQFQPVDFTLHVLEARLGLLQQQVRTALGLADDPSGLV